MTKINILPLPVIWFPSYNSTWHSILVNSVNRRMTKMLKKRCFTSYQTQFYYMYYTACIYASCTVYTTSLCHEPCWAIVSIVIYISLRTYTHISCQDTVHTNTAQPRLEEWEMGQNGRQVHFTQPRRWVSAIPGCRKWGQARSMWQRSVTSNNTVSFNFCCSQARLTRLH